MNQTHRAKEWWTDHSSFAYTCRVFFSWKQKHCIEYNLRILSFQENFMTTLVFVWCWMDQERKISWLVFLRKMQAEAEACKMYIEWNKILFSRENQNHHQEWSVRSTYKSSNNGILLRHQVDRNSTIGKPILFWKKSFVYSSGELGTSAGVTGTPSSYSPSSSSLIFPSGDEKSSRIPCITSS